MFELLDDNTSSPLRMPSRFSRTNPSAEFNGWLFVVAIGALVLSESLQTVRAAQIVVWSIAAGAGWWFVYRCVRQIETVWRSDPTRKVRLLIGSVVLLLAILTIVYAFAIKSEMLLWAFSTVVWGLSLLTAGVQHLRRRGEPARRRMLLIESAVFVLTLPVLVYVAETRSQVPSGWWLPILIAPWLMQLLERQRESRGHS
jgi:hypothetical protein